MPITNHSPPAEKIALFRRLFRGREEVYPVRFVSKKTGRAGYSPVCGNEWVRGVCEKPRIKCSECAHQAWLPVTDEVIRRHLSGEIAAGVYAMLADESCWFLAVDFDGEGWQEEVRAFVEVAEELEISTAVERSRSGHGGHVWVFFAEAVTATLARRLGALILTRALVRFPRAKFSAYDRFFPNQDTLPRGGFGNLIALPLQKEARVNGNSSFVNEEWEPLADQWEFLGKMNVEGRVTRAKVEGLLERVSSQEILGIRRVEVEEEAATEPWKLSPSRMKKEVPKGTMPKELQVTLGDQIYVPKTELPAAVINGLARLAAFQNPEFYRAQAMRLSTYDQPRIISCAEDYSEHLALPRGCWEEVRELLEELGVALQVDDERKGGADLKVKFQGELRPEQAEAAQDLLAHDTGVLAATTAFGKTVLAAYVIAQREVNTLVLVHRQQLMNQWVERLSQFLGVEEKEIGRLGGGRKKLTGKLDVALIQSLVRKEVVKDLVADYGQVIIDECHHLSARSFELVARRAKARYVLGLSATVTRKDGHHPIIFMQCGPVRHRVSAKSQAAARPFAHEVVVRPTGFVPSFELDENPRVAFQQLCDAVWQDEGRNRMIAGEVLAAVRAGRVPMVLTERTEHLDLLTQLLEEEVRHLIVLRGGLTKKELAAAMSEIRDLSEKESRVILATGKFVGEGFDDSRLNTLFLTMPVSWKGTIAQYAGRLHRLHEGKEVVQVYDYADLDVPMLARMFDRRCVGYEEIGYQILLPASALPGWPVEVPLPIDPQWKNDHAASVRRLIQDGVDLPLAKLFVQCTQPANPKARSASESFLFSRLESLEATRGMFELNVQLPIPFNDRSTVEVDFFCQQYRLVIELDGDQHLGDAEAYRRDRRKDALLQEEGYFILRFLASDLGKNLNRVLDAVVRTLVHLGRD